MQKIAKFLQQLEHLMNAQQADTLSTVLYCAIGGLQVARSVAAVRMTIRNEEAAFQMYLPKLQQFAGMRRVPHFQAVIEARVTEIIPARVRAEEEPPNYAFLLSVGEIIEAWMFKNKDNPQGGFTVEFIKPIRVRDEQALPLEDED